MFSCTWPLQQMAALSWVPPRFGLLLYCRRFVQYGVQNCENTMQKKNTAIMEVFYCFTIAIGLPGDASNYNKDKRSAVTTRIQNRVVLEWGSSENKEWDAALKQLSEKNHAMCVVLLRLMKTKNFNMLLSFCQHWHLTWQNWANFFRRYILTLHRWKLP